MTVSVKVAKDYTHIQTTPSAVWTIDYKMSFLPIVEILIDNNGTFEKMIPQSIERLTDHSVAVHFSMPFAGKAHIVG